MYVHNGIFLTCPPKILVNLSAILTLVASCRVEGVWEWVMSFNWEMLSVSLSDIGVNLKWVPSSWLLVVRNSLSSDDTDDRASERTGVRERSNTYTKISYLLQYGVFLLICTSFCDSVFHVLAESR